MSEGSGRTKLMYADKELAAGLTQALLNNARDLAADARLLFEHERFARCYALAALAGEELGKIAICLDWLFGDSTSSLKETRRAWQSHDDKLSSLVAYRAAFIDDPAGIRPESLRDEAREVAGRKLDALYVDVRDGVIKTPAQVAAADAKQLLGQVEDAVSHAVEHLRPMTSEVASAIEVLAPQFVAPLSAFIDSLSPQDAVEALRRLVSTAQTFTDQEWADALQGDRVLELLASTPAATRTKTAGWSTHPNTRDE